MHFLFFICLSGFFFYCVLLSVSLNSSIASARYVSCVGFEDLMDEEEEGSKPEYSLTSYTALQAHSLSPTTSAANLSSRIKSSSGIIL